MNRLLLSLAVLASGLAFQQPAPAEENSRPGDSLFGTAKVVQLHLTMSEKQFADLAPKGQPRFGPPGFGPPGAEPAPPPENASRNTFGVDLPWSSGDLQFEGQTFKNVGVRYKGNYTFMATAQSLKKSLKIDINRHESGQKLDGLTMFNLHCGVSDPTQARESLSYAYFREAGVPAPRTCLCELSLTVPGKYDKEYVGVYTLVEQVNKTFLKRHFQDGAGMLLKPEGLQGGPTFLGEDWAPYEARYRPEDEPTDQQKQRLIAFARLVDGGADEAFTREIGDYLDVEAFLRFIAANTLLSNLDSYLAFGHNYYLYLSPKTNKFVFIPWDLDLSLATWPAVGSPEQLVKLSIHHPHAGNDRLLDRLFAIPDHKARYLAILQELTATSFTKEKLLAMLEPVEEALSAPLEAQAKAVAARQEVRQGGFGFGFGGGQFGQSMPPRKFIEERTASLAAQFAGEAGFEPRPFGFGFGPGGPGARPGGRGPGAPGFGGRGAGPGGPRRGAGQTPGGRQRPPLESESSEPGASQPDASKPDSSQPAGEDVTPPAP